MKNFFSSPKLVGFHFLNHLLQIVSQGFMIIQKYFLLGIVESHRWSYYYRKVNDSSIAVVSNDFYFGIQQL